MIIILCAVFVYVHVHWEVCMPMPMCKHAKARGENLERTVTCMLPSECVCALCVDMWRSVQAWCPLSFHLTPLRPEAKTNKL